MKISAVFEEEPWQWGFRGDPYLWRELKERLSAADMPETAAQLQAVIEQEYEAATGYPISHEQHFTLIAKLRGENLGQEKAYGMNKDFSGCPIKQARKRA